jgi:hypothetical protein
VIAHEQLRRWSDRFRDTDLIAADVAQLLDDHEAWRDIVAKAEIWRHWWLLTHSKSFMAADPHMERLVKLRDAAESELEKAVAVLTAPPQEAK